MGLSERPGGSAFPKGDASEGSGCHVLGEQVAGFSAVTCEGTCHAFVGVGTDKNTFFVDFSADIEGCRACAGVLQTHGGGEL